MRIKDLLALAGAGRKLFPVVYAGKKPVEEGWMGCVEQAGPIETFEKFGDKINVGMVVGIPSGVLTIDCDFKHPEAIRFWETHQGSLSVGCVVNTGNGKHCHFKHPHPDKRVVSSIGGICKGIDLLCDTKIDGYRYVLIPNSLHPDGKYYEYADPFAGTLVDELPDMPTELLALINDRSKWVGKQSEGASSLPEGMGISPADWYAENPHVLFSVDPFDDEPILEGNRNNDLAKIAGKLLYMNDSNSNYLLDDLKDDMAEVNTKRCDPPLPSFEIEQLCESIFKTKVRRDEKKKATGGALNQANLDGFKINSAVLSETGILGGSSRVGLAFSSGVLPKPESKPEPRDDINGCAIWVLHQQPFAPDEQGRDHNLVYLEGQFFQRYQHVWVQVSDQSVESVFQSFYIMAKKGQISNMMSFAKNYLYLPMRSMPFWKAGFPTQGYPNDPRKIIPFSNGLFDVEHFVITGDIAGSLKPFTDNLFNTMKLPYDLVPGATCPQWEVFLASIWGSATCERSEFLQEWIGHLMVPDITQHKIAVLHGTPRSGKSTIGRMIQRIIGKENVAAANLHAMANNHGLSPYVGKNAMIFFDAHMGSKGSGEQALELLKSISGGDPVQVNPKFLNPYDIILSARIMIICNEIPRFRDAGNALLARLVPLRFDKTFFGKENHNLEVDLVKELPGIANWALAGIRKYISNGRLSTPTDATRDIIDIKRIMNPVSAFADDCLIFPTADANDFAYVNDMHKAWVMWAEENYVSFVDTKDRFLSKLRAVTPTVVQTRRKGLPAWTGIRFREEAQQRYLLAGATNEVLF